MTMPRTLQEILDHADQLAARFEQHEPNPWSERDPEPLKRLTDAVQQRAEAERAIAKEVDAMRAAGYSWTTIGGLLGTSGQATRERYGRRVRP